MQHCFVLLCRYLASLRGHVSAVYQVRVSPPPSLGPPPVTKILMHTGSLVIRQQVAVQW